MTRLESLSGLLDLDFPEYQDPPSAPDRIIEKWIDEARGGAVREPDALALATVPDSGAPSIRTVVPLRVRGTEIWFATHRTSRKSRDIETTGLVAGHYYWRELGRQIAFQAQAFRAPSNEADRAWLGRDAAYDPVSVASHQSERLDDPVRLEAEVASLAGRGKLPRPQRFVVYRLSLTACEFWSACSSRLHKRLHYVRDAKGWNHERLQP